MYHNQIKKIIIDVFSTYNQKEAYLEHEKLNNTRKGDDYNYI